MVARTLGVMAAAEKHLQQPSPKRTRSEQPVSHGCLSGRQWVDVQRAARIAGATNVQLTVHGIVVDGSAARQQQLTQQLQPQNQGTVTVPSASQLAAPATSTSSTIVADAAPPRSPNARHRRSQRRLQDYQQAKTALAQQPPSQQPPQLPKTPPPEPHPRAAHDCLEGVINLNSSKQSSAPPMPTPPPMPSPPPPMPSPPPPIRGDRRRHLPRCHHHNQIHHVHPCHPFHRLRLHGLRNRLPCSPPP